MIAVQPSPRAGKPPAHSKSSRCALCSWITRARCFSPDVPELRVLGRIAFLLYAWCLVVGFHYTRAMWKYGLRLLLVGAVSQPLYACRRFGTWTEPNILTLLMGLLALICTFPRKHGARTVFTLRIVERALTVWAGGGSGMDRSPAL